MKKILLLAAALLFVAGGALGEAQKDEVVYARLDESGAAREIYVVNGFSADAPEAFVDYGDYAEALSLTPGLEVALADGAVELNLPAGRSYYQGTPGDLALPWLISIRYLMDGAELEPAGLSGADGQLRIEMDISQNPAAPAGWYEAYALQVTATLDANSCNHPRAEGGTIVSAGGSYAVSWIVLPGSGGTLTLEADVADFHMAPIQFAGVRLHVTIDAAPFSGTLGMAERMSTALSTGAAALSAGLTDAAGAADTLSQEMAAFGDAMAAFGEKLTEADALSTEFEGLLSGYAEILSGADGLAGGVEGARQTAEQVSAAASLFAAGLENIDISAMAEQVFGGPFEMRSYLSPENGSTRSVQFVLMTKEIAEK